MKIVTIVLLVILLILVAVAVALYFMGKRAQKKQAEQEEALQSAKQTVSMLIIDKKRMKMKESGLPQLIIDQTPWYLRGSKLPIVKAKVGPTVMNLVADEKVFDLIPTKKEVKATVAGIYILDVKGIRGTITPAAAGTKKKSKFKEAIEKLQEKAGAKPLK